MRITWYGHAAFLIETDGLRIILDPYRSPDCGGYRPISEPADLVVVSHENDRYHSHLGQIVPPFEVVDALHLPTDGLTVRGTRIEAIPCFETPEKLPGDEVTIVLIRSEGLRLVFLGDLGHSLDDDAIATIRGAEIVLAAAGGPPTIAYPELVALLEAVGPRVVIPMHFKTSGIDLKIQPVERFLESVPGWPVERPGGASWEATAESLPSGPRVIRLEHAR